MLQLVIVIVSTMSHCIIPREIKMKNSFHSYNTVMHLQKESEDFDMKKKKLKNNLGTMGKLENSMKFLIFLLV